MFLSAEATIDRRAGPGARPADQAMKTARVPLRHRTSGANKGGPLKKPCGSWHPVRWNAGYVSRDPCQVDSLRPWFPPSKESSSPRQPSDVAAMWATRIATRPPAGCATRRGTHPHDRPLPSGLFYDVFSQASSHVDPPAEAASGERAVRSARRGIAASSRTTPLQLHVLPSTPAKIGPHSHV